MKGQAIETTTFVGKIEATFVLTAITETKSVAYMYVGLGKLGSPNFEHDNSRTYIKIKYLWCH